MEQWSSRKSLRVVELQVFAKGLVLTYLREDKLLVNAVKIKEGFVSARSPLTHILAELPSNSLQGGSGSVSSSIPLAHEIWACLEPGLECLFCFLVVRACQEQQEACNNDSLGRIV